jgi:hypothetical protein
MKIGRNDPCPCGSGKKYKHCCYDKDLTARQAEAAAAHEEAAKAEAAAAEADEDDGDEAARNAHEKVSFQERQRKIGQGRSFPTGPEAKSRVRRGAQRGG